MGSEPGLGNTEAKMLTPSRSRSRFGRQKETDTLGGEREGGTVKRDEIRKGWFQWLDFYQKGRTRRVAPG